MAQIELPTTQRAYTLRLRGVDPQDNLWRDALWATHKAVNEGAKVFGDWLLTLRGGLSHELAEPPQPKSKRSLTQDEIDSQRRNRRVLLALSWLSVEDARGAPKGDDVRITTGEDSTDHRRERLIEALRTILTARDVEQAQIKEWERDCSDSLAARIRDDAVWVNRSAAFDAAVHWVGPSLAREEIWDILEPFFGSREAYMAPLVTADDDDNSAGEEKAKDLVQKAGQWLSSRFGTGTGADFESMAAVYAAMSEWAAHAEQFGSGPEALHNLADALSELEPKSPDADGILSLISGPGYKSATRNLVKAWSERSGSVTADDVMKFGETAAKDEAKCRANTGGKGRRPWSDAVLKSVEDACRLTYLQKDGPARHSEFAVMLDHAARRVSIGHSWIKRAEAERRRFEADADRLIRVPSEAGQRLDEFTGQRSGSSGALAAGNEYRIRKRAVEGWEEVVTRWKRAGCKTEEDRRAVAREVQGDWDKDKKFGDIQLFEALAADDALCVWQTDGKADPQILKDYVAGHDARFRRQRFKVPAYRHPDMLRHPVFCDFGNSRWDVDYALHRRRSGLDAAQEKVKRYKDAVEKAQAGLDRAKTPEKQTKAEEKLAVSRRKLAEAQDELAWLEDPRAMRLRLWTGNAIEPIDSMRWSSKRLAADLGSRDHSRDAEVAVSRGDRLGRAAAGVSENTTAIPAGLFEQKEWNARLQAPRRELDRLAARVERYDWDGKARKMRDNLSWLVTLSAKLECRGPWYSYFEQQTDQSPFLKEVKSGARKGQTYATPNGWPHAIPNDKRDGHAKLILSRLPNLRVLSVDLGHRFAAACAVWETISDDAMRRGIGERTIRAGGMGKDDLYCHVETPTDKVVKSGQNKGKSVTEITIYRRIGADKLSDGSEHPAPWARLDRQFFIKLQGEDKPARRASDAEIDKVRAFEEAIGRHRIDEYDQLPQSVDKLMGEAVRSARLGLRRLGDAARIANALVPGSCQHPPGGGTKPHTEESRKNAMLGALVRWHELRRAAEARWRDSEAGEMWDERIAPRLTNALPDAPDEASGVGWKAHRNSVEQALKPLADELAARGEAGVPELFDLWQGKWHRNREQWQSHLKWLNRWLMPRGLRSSEADSEQQAAERRTKRRDARHVGGLSLTRIATMRSLWQVQKAYYYGPCPENPRAGVDKIEEDAKHGRKFGERALRSMERMREQRVKQLASRIAEAALGAGCHKPAKPGKHDRKRPRMRTDAPCHAIVIENLRNYRPDELQTRRENRALMAWSAANVRKYLDEACQLHGLHLREVMPNYTSRQCSRTGLPGMRCVDVRVDQTSGEPQAYWWKNRLAAAKKKVDADGSGGKAEDRFIVALAKYLEEACSSGSLPRKDYTVQIPRRGGDLFVVAPAWDQLKRGEADARSALQADLNAAANIGLRALFDPDFAGKWWYIPCDSTTGMPAKDKCAGAACLPHNKQIFSSSQQAQHDVTNMWRDPAGIIADSDWKPHTAYWNAVESRIMGQLRWAIGLPDDPG